MKKTVMLLLGSLLLSACSSEQTEKPSSDMNPGTFTHNGHTYELDAVSGATQGQKEGTRYQGEAKRAKMMWSGRPEIGTVSGDYYYGTYEFDGGYRATLALVKKDDVIQMVEFDEIAPENYYSPDYAMKHKRLSGYANWQMDNNRTDINLVTIVNAMNFIEAQIMEQNDLSLDYYAPNGASNSLRHGFEPLAHQMATKIQGESPYTYIAITEAIADNSSARLVVILEKTSGKIHDIMYDEYFPDTEAEITDPNLKEFMRQSKYYAINYPTKTGFNFQTTIDSLKQAVLEQQTLDVDVDERIAENYLKLVQKLTPLIP